MQRRTAKATQAQKAEKARRGFARLLARIAATEQFEKELRAKPNGANSLDTPARDEAEDLP
jgi:hypothetical protein